MGRPRKQIDQVDFESLLGLQCTLSEIVAFFDNKLGGCSEDTIERWCKRTYHASFAEVSAKKRDMGKISIRRMQLQLAEKNPSMAIWLGKQYLGQREHVAVEANLQVEDDPITKALKESGIIDNGLK